MDAFIKTVDQLGVKNVAGEVYTQYWQKEKSKEFIKNYKHLKVDELRDKAYTSFTGMFMKDTTSKKMFFDILEKEGYNAIIDENDKKFGNGFTETPMIVFNKQNNLKTSSSTAITDKDAEYFRDLYFNGNDEYYMNKTYKDSISKWDKWAGTKERREI